MLTTELVFSVARLFTNRVVIVYAVSLRAAAHHQETAARLPRNVNA